MFETRLQGLLPRHTIFGLIDQGCASGGNFLLNAALARTLDLSVYGCFATAFVCGLLATVIHNGALLDPMSMLGGTRDGRVSAAYVAEQLREHFRFSARLALLPAIVGAALWIAGHPVHGQAFMLSAVSLPATLMLPLVRRLLIVGSHHSQAALAAFLYFVGVVGCYLVVVTYLDVTMVSAYGILASASIIGSLTLLRKYSPSNLWAALTASGLRARHAAERRHARYLVPAAILTFAMTQLQVPIISLLLGSEEAGLYRAMQLPMIAIGQVISAAATVALPRLALAHAQEDHVQLRSGTRRLIAALLCVCFTAELILVVFHREISLVIYGQRFGHATWLMPLIGAVAVSSCWGTALATALKAMQASRTQLTVTAATACVGIPCAIILTTNWGIAGAAASAVVNYLVFSIMNARAYREWTRRSSIEIHATVHAA